MQSLGPKHRWAQPVRFRVRALALAASLLVLAPSLIVSAALPTSSQVAQAASASASSATAVKGVWRIRTSVNGGHVALGTMTLAPSGPTSFSGTLNADNGDTGGIKGKISCRNVRFKATFALPGELYIVTYVGTVGGNSMTGFWGDNFAEGGNWYAWRPSATTLRSLGAGASASSAPRCAPSPTVDSAVGRAVRGATVITTIKVSGLGPRKNFGPADLSVFGLGTARRVKLTTMTLAGNAQAAVATVRLDGRKSCWSKLSAKISQNGASDSASLDVANGQPVITVARAVRVNSGIELTLNIDDARAVSACGKPKLTATVAGARRITVKFRTLQFKGTTAVGTAHLPASRKCSTQIPLLISQVGLQASADPLVTGEPVPTTCTPG